ncbi:uncharacterized protein [Haliotis asinina]|uniref:uncharacterized protein n=1 Tax=Haliotis asinina TaxID=109174 RepID=UPI003531D99B
MNYNRRLNIVAKLSKDVKKAKRLILKHDTVLSETKCRLFGDAFYDIMLKEVKHIIDTLIGSPFRECPQEEVYLLGAHSTSSPPSTEVSKATLPEVEGERETVNPLGIADSLIPEVSPKYASMDPDKFLSPIFMVPKKDGGQRPIINLKALNAHIPYIHFKLEGLHLLRDLIRKGDCLCKLKDAYFSVPMAPHMKKVLHFSWKGVLYQFRYMPFGLAPAPRAFTKLLRPVIDTVNRTLILPEEKVENIVATCRYIVLKKQGAFAFPDLRLNDYPAFRLSGGTEVMDNQPHQFQREADHGSSSRRDSPDGCIKERMGSNTRSEINRRPVVRDTTENAHQCSRTEGNSFCKGMKDQTIMVQVDNQTTMAYVNRFGGGQSMCLWKIRKDKAELVIITPVWQGQSWYLLLLEMAVTEPILLPRMRDLLYSPQNLPHPLIENNTLVLVAWKVSGVASRPEDFQKRLLSCSPANGDPAHKALTMLPGIGGVAGAIIGVLIPFQPLWSPS